MSDAVSWHPPLIIPEHPAMRTPAPGYMNAGGRIPTEIRVMIFEHALVEFTIYDNTCTLATLEEIREPGLLTVDRLTREEALPIYRKITLLTIEATYCSVSYTLQYFKSGGLANLTHIKIAGVPRSNLWRVKHRGHSLARKSKPGFDEASWIEIKGNEIKVQPVSPPKNSRRSTCEVVVPLPVRRMLEAVFGRPLKRVREWTEE